MKRKISKDDLGVIKCEIDSLNYTVDYCFGRVSEEDWQEFLSETDVEPQSIEDTVGFYKKAIEYGLTFEMSIYNGPDMRIWTKRQEIFDKVNYEMFEVVEND